MTWLLLAVVALINTMLLAVGWAMLLAMAVRGG
jgi:hypothetical protein